ncbi:MAG: hypothetical protein WA432_02440 [Candidatus Babeliaceae bacterium]
MGKTLAGIVSFAAPSTFFGGVSFVTYKCLQPVFKNTLNQLINNSPLEKATLAGILGLLVAPFAWNNFGPAMQATYSIFSFQGIERAKK